MPEGPRAVLVRAPNWVGDAVMATPALRALRAAQPQARIVVLGRPGIGVLLRGLRSFDAFLPDPGRGLRAAGGLVRALRRERFDWAVLLPDSVRAAWPARAAGIPLRAGYARDPLRRLLLTHPLEPPSENGRRVPIPMVERYARIVRALGCPDLGTGLDLALDEDAALRLAKDLEARGVGAEEPLLAVTPGASFGASKLWPPDHFAAACDRLARLHGLRPVLAPGPGEEALAARIAQAATCAPVLLAAPPLDLAGLKALVARSALVLTNDTGPRQIAVALGRPAIVLMGPTDPRHTAVNLERQAVLREPVACSPCHHKSCPIDHRCMTRLDPERVVQAARALLA
jgi:heptosyltransferase-2